MYGNMMTGSLMSKQLKFGVSNFDVDHGENEDATGQQVDYQMLRVVDYQILIPNSLSTA